MSIQVHKATQPKREMVCQLQVQPKPSSHCSLISIHKHTCKTSSASVSSCSSCSLLPRCIYDGNAACISIPNGKVERVCFFAPFLICGRRINMQRDVPENPLSPSISILFFSFLFIHHSISPLLTHSLHSHAHRSPPRLRFTLTPAFPFPLIDMSIFF